MALKGTEILDHLLKECDKPSDGLCFVVSRDVFKDVGQLEYKGMNVYAGYFQFDKNKAMIINEAYYIKWGLNGHKQLLNLWEQI